MGRRSLDWNEVCFDGPDGLGLYVRNGMYGVCLELMECKSLILPCLSIGTQPHLFSISPNLYEIESLFSCMRDCRSAFSSSAYVCNSVRACMI